MNILSIDTSCDETSAAVTNERKVITNVVFSQIPIHAKWGGVVPSLAKRAHEDRIDGVVEKALQKIPLTSIGAVAVTQGPGLAMALEVGIQKAKELAAQNKIPLIAVNHLEGHLYSVFAQNSQGNPPIAIHFPYLAMIISGGHTEFVLWKGHLDYEVLGETLDDAAGEALDKAGKLLGLGYPAGAVLERLAGEVGNRDKYAFPRPMLRSSHLQLSFSGLKTSFYYFLKKMPEKDIHTKIRELSSSFQEAVFDTILFKTEKAISQTGVTNLVVVGGVAANTYLRRRFRLLANKHGGTVLFPPTKKLTGDNAAMIGIAAWQYAEKKQWAGLEMERIPRFSLSSSCKCKKIV